MCTAIQVEDLHVSYQTKDGKQVDAVSGLSFSVHGGEVVGFLGPNGAGKSSTLKALMGFVEPVSGTCKIFGKDAGSLEAKAEVGYLPEVAMYYPFLTPLETLRLYGELQGLGGKQLKREAEELLELVGLKDLGKKLNKNLSKGMLQRVGIAQSLLGNPRLLILDEVTSGVDPVGRKELRTIMKERQKRGTTLFFSSHELSEVDMLCDRIILISRGTFVEERNMNRLKEELRNFSLLYRAAPPLIGLANEITECGDGSIKANFSSKQALLMAIESVGEHRGIILDIVAEEGSLEDYFVERMAA